jgi:hypothetical protein
VSWDFRSGTLSPLASAFATSSSGPRSTLGLENDKAAASTSTERSVGTITFQFDTMASFIFRRLLDFHFLLERCQLTRITFRVLCFL